MSSIKKVLCIKAKNNHGRTFITNKIYDVEIDGGCGWVKDENGYSTCILFVTSCIYGEWQQLEEYVCMTHTLLPELKPGETLYGYAKNGVLNFHHEGMIASNILGLFKKLSDIPQVAQYFPCHEVRHVIYDTKDNKIVNDAMGECYITLAEAQEVCDEMNAPKVMKSKYTKEIEYFGMKVFVPDDAKWLSATESGEIIAHTCISKPAEINSCGLYIGTESHKDHYVAGGIDLNGIDWKETLVEIK